MPPMVAVLMVGVLPWCLHPCQRPVCRSVLVLLLMSTHCRRWSVAGCCIPADVPAACMSVLVAVVSVLLSACRSASVPMVSVLVLVRCGRSLGVWCPMVGVLVVVRCCRSLGGWVAVLGVCITTSGLYACRCWFCC